MKSKFLLALCQIVLLSSCGRQHPGKIINNTDETLFVTLKFNYPFTDFCPDNYFREEVIANYKFHDTLQNATSYYTIRYDSVSETAVLKFLPEAEIDLGTVRLGGGDRNNYRSWEFNQITCKGNKGYIMHAKDKQLMNYIDKPLLFSSYDFVIE